MLECRKCDCGYWEIAGLPCQHAMAAMGYARHKVQEYVPTCFSRQAYLSTYSVMFSPLPDQCTWEPTGRPLIDPPIVERKIGRPKKSRKRAANEPQKEKRKFFVICSFCGGSNHNVRSCPLRPSVARSNRAMNNNFQVYLIYYYYLLCLSLFIICDYYYLLYLYYHHVLQASTILSQPLNASEQAIRRRKQVLLALIFHLLCLYGLFYV